MAISEIFQAIFDGMKEAEKAMLGLDGTWTTRDRVVAQLSAANTGLTVYQSIGKEVEEIEQVMQSIQEASNYDKPPMAATTRGTVAIGVLPDGADLTPEQADEWALALQRFAEQARQIRGR